MVVVHSLLLDLAPDRLLERIRNVIPSQIFPRFRDICRYKSKLNLVRANSCHGTTAAPPKASDRISMIYYPKVSYFSGGSSIWPLRPTSSEQHHHDDADACQLSSGLFSLLVRLRLGLDTKSKDCEKWTNHIVIVLPTTNSSSLSTGGVFVDFRRSLDGAHSSRRVDRGCLPWVNKRHDRDLGLVLYDRKVKEAPHILREQQKAVRRVLYDRKVKEAPHILREQQKAVRRDGQARSWEGMWACKSWQK